MNKILWLLALGFGTIISFIIIDAVVNYLWGIMSYAGVFTLVAEGIIGMILLQWIIPRILRR